MNKKIILLFYFIFIPRVFLKELPKIHFIKIFLFAPLFFVFLRVLQLGYPHLARQSKKVVLVFFSSFLSFFL